MWKALKQYVEPDMLMQSVEEVWEGLWSKLTSGFPYYAFRSRFAWWWKQCVRHGLPRASDPIIDVTKIEQIAIPENRQLDSRDAPLRSRRISVGQDDVLIPCAKTDKPASAKHGKPPRRPAEEVIRGNEKVRERWIRSRADRIRCRVADDAGEKRMVKEIAARFPDIGENTIDTYCRRLRLRLWAYQLARLRGLSNAEILSSDASAGCARGEPCKVNWKSVGAVSTIASLARAVPPDHTLLWAFAAHVFSTTGSIRRIPIRRRSPVFFASFGIGSTTTPSTKPSSKAAGTTTR